MPKPQEEIPGDSSDTEEMLSVNEMFELLSNQRRRYVLYYLWGTEGLAQLESVAKQIAAWEFDTNIRQVPADKRKTVYTSLQQFHLAKMDEQNVVTFRKRDGTIELDSAAENLKRYLEPFQKANSGGSLRGLLNQMPLQLSLL